MTNSITGERVLIRITIHMQWRYLRFVMAEARQHRKALSQASCRHDIQAPGFPVPPVGQQTTINHLSSNILCCSHSLQKTNKEDCTRCLVTVKTASHSSISFSADSSSFYLRPFHQKSKKHRCDYLSLHLWPKLKFYTLS